MKISTKRFIVGIAVAIVALVMSAYILITSDNYKTTIYRTDNFKIDNDGRLIVNNTIYDNIDSAVYTNGTLKIVQRNSPIWGGIAVLGVVICSCLAGILVTSGFCKRDEGN